MAFDHLGVGVQDPAPDRASRANYVVLLRIAVVVSVLLALVLVHLTSRWGVGWRLITFTYQANLLAAGFAAWTLISPRAGMRAGLRGAVVVYVVVAGVIWNLFLTEESMGYTPANILLHMLVPVLVIAEALLTDDVQPRLHWWHPPIWLIYPAIYLVFALLLLNHSGRRIPYYFLDADRIGAVGLALNVSLLAAMFLGVGYGVVLLNRWRIKATSEIIPVAGI
jgi:hypothetical protein